MSNKRVIEVLKRARNLVAKGWNQGPLEDRKGRVKTYCAWGAVRKVLGAPRTDFRPSVDRDVMSALANDRTLRASLLRRGERRYSDRNDVISFNEHERRTRAQVVALFDRTIARLERQQQA